MLNYKIADLIIGVKSKYSYNENLCKDYIYNYDEKADIKINICDEIVLKAYEKEPQYSIGYHESLEIYRELCAKILDFNGFLFHSSIISVNNKAYAFTAISGTGKSTHTKLWREYFRDKAIMVNDDKPIIRFIDNEFYAYGTPHAGKDNLQNNIRVKLEGICFLEQSKENWICKINKGEAVLKIFDQTLRPNNIDKMDKLLKLLDELIKKVPMYKMGCNISTEAVKVSYSTMKK